MNGCPGLEKKDAYVVVVCGSKDGNSDFGGGDDYSVGTCFVLWQLLHNPRDGAMPWEELGYNWTIVNANDANIDGDAVSMHWKWWVEPPGGSDKARDLCGRVR